MNKKPLTKKKREQLATEIFNFLVDNNLWQDVCIYFNGKRWSTHNRETNEFYYNEQKYYEDKADPHNYFDYVREPNILSMSFEGPLYELLNGYDSRWSLEEKFMKIFEKYGVYYELGNAWNLSCYEI